MGAGLHMGVQARQWILTATAGRHIRQGRKLGVSTVVGSGFGAQSQLGETLGLHIKLLRVQKQGLGGQSRALRVIAQQAVAFFGVLPEALEGSLQVVMQHQRAIGGQVVKHRGGVVKKQRQIVLDTRGGYACAHVFVQTAAGGITLHQFAPA